MNSSEYKHVVLGLVFLQYIDDAFSERRRQLIDDLDDEGSPASRATRCWSPETSTPPRALLGPARGRWGQLQAGAKQPEIGKLIDNAMDLVELDNPSLSGLLPNFSLPALDVRRLGELVDLISGIGSARPSIGRRTFWGGCTSTSWAPRTVGDGHTETFRG